MKQFKAKKKIIEEIIAENKIEEQGVKLYVFKHNVSIGDKMYKANSKHELNASEYETLKSYVFEFNRTTTKPCMTCPK